MPEFHVHVDPDDLALTDLAAAVDLPTPSRGRDSGRHERGRHRGGKGGASRRTSTQPASTTRQYAFRRS
ncbi:hypothetical protein [Rhizomonospora bruguierae]|uniref:hypothetical protein n=1 Tax=Rhizomonospora bruguierae TaxID=1581705 RepID=UPI001BCE387B|nr:hypothetical protein [Micromonospora sp. NBRC 107566]